MGKGLKQMVAEAEAGATVAPAPTPPAPPPVHVSGVAHKTLASAFRRWSGWKTANLVLAPPPSAGSVYGSTEHVTRTVHVNVDALCRNPNRVLNVLTPFRMRQEALISGVMMHEAGHARHSHWRPRTEAQVKAFKHGSYGLHAGEPVNMPTLKFAALMEEARIEGLMVRHATTNGTYGLEWTMRAASAAISPMTVLAADPNQQLMDLLTAWTLRAGKQRAVSHWDKDYRKPAWVDAFNDLVHEAMTAHLDSMGLPNAKANASALAGLMYQMITCTDDTGTFMVDQAREVLDVLFPETDPDDVPSPSGGCSGAGEGLPEHPLDNDKGDSDEEGETGTEEGEGADGGGSDGESVGGGVSASGDQGDAAEAKPTDTTSALAKALAALEKEAGYEQAKASEAEAEQAPDPASQVTGNGASAGSGGRGTGDWRNPTAFERDIQHGAERFLRDMVDPSVTSKIKITSDPSSSIDPASYAAWKATGQTTAPRFFRRTKRVVTSSPPVKVAVLVDVSMSMGVLAEPSAVLSWALSAAALDLRNFAGHGVQVESTLIHWGSSARVIQKNGHTLPGIRDHTCGEYTDALAEAFALVEQEIPGFLGVQEKPTNRLLVHFTDWALGRKDGVAIQAAALMNGVNTLSVVPSSYDARQSSLDAVLRNSQGRTGTCALMKYDRRHPDQVWAKASELLS